MSLRPREENLTRNGAERNRSGSRQDDLTLTPSEDGSTAVFTHLCWNEGGKGRVEKATYVAGSLRADGLPAVSQYGIISAQDHGGHHQNVFKDAAPNYSDPVGRPVPQCVLTGIPGREKTPIGLVRPILADGRVYTVSRRATGDDAQVIAGTEADATVRRE